MERELLLMLVFIVHWIVLSATVNELQGVSLRNRISTKWDFNTTLIIYFVELCSSFTFLRNESNIYRKQFSIFLCLFFVCVHL